MTIFSPQISPKLIFVEQLGIGHLGITTTIFERGMNVGDSLRGAPAVLVLSELFLDRRSGVSLSGRIPDPQVGRIFLTR